MKRDIQIRGNVRVSKRPTSMKRDVQKQTKVRVSKETYIYEKRRTYETYDLMRVCMCVGRCGGEEERKEGGLFSFVLFSFDMHRSLLRCVCMCVDGCCCSDERKDKKKVSFHIWRSLFVSIGLFSYASVSFQKGQEECLFFYI